MKIQVAAQLEYSLDIRVRTLDMRGRQEQKATPLIYAPTGADQNGTGIGGAYQSPERKVQKIERFSASFSRKEPLAISSHILGSSSVKFRQTQ